jgi:mono/diheme cytochrome c family protein
MGKRSVLGLGTLMVMVLLVVALVAISCGGGAEESTSTTAAVTTTSGSATTAGTIDAAALYAENCAGCHENGVSGSASEIETIVNDGADEMPAFGDRLSGAEVAALAAYAADGGK